MYLSPSQKRVSLAILFGTAVIALALMVKQDPLPQDALTVVNGEPVIVTAAPERQAIPIADSNGDGVPDWQESLQATEALALGSTTAAFIPPETLTDEFALNFFEQMVRNEQYGEFGKSPEELVSSFSTSLAAEAVDTIITSEQIVTTSDNSPNALAEYGERIAQIILAHDDPVRENEAVILERALRDNNPEELRKLDGKIDVYTQILKETLVVPVPSTVTNEHLVLVNAYQAILADLYAMRDAFSDPMLALLRIKRYQDDATALATALVDITNKLLAGGARWSPDSPMLQIVTISQ